MTRGDTIISIRELYRSFGQAEILRGLCLDIRKGETTVILGPSGCGKSVLLKHMAGLLKPQKGEILFHDTNVTKFSESQWYEIRRKMGFLFQGAALFDSMTVEENIFFPMLHHDIGNAVSRKKRCDEVLGFVGLGGYNHRLPAELSGGQQKRIALARAIVLEPEVIFYDEPTTGLDPMRADLINELILKLQRELKITSVVVTHDLTSARKVADRIVMLDAGKILIDTTPKKLDEATDHRVRCFLDGRADEQELAGLEL